MQSKEANSMMEKLKAYTNNFIHDESGGRHCGDFCFLTESFIKSRNNDWRLHK